VIRNQYSRSIIEASTRIHAPFWGEKLRAPAFFKEDKLKRFYKQWDLRLGLEILKIRHAIVNINNRKHYPEMRDEIDAYIQYAKKEDQKEFMQDIYVTNHEPRIPKYHTINSAEDEEYFRYIKSLEEYNNEKLPSYVPSTRVGMFNYKKGSLM
jgi:hypothetical protein